MTDAIPPSTDYAKHENITQVSRVAITPDGHDAMLVLDQEHEEKIALTLPTKALKQLQASITRLIEMAEARGLEPGVAPIQKVGSFMVGHADQIRGHVILNFDPGTPNEKIFAVLDADAVKLFQLVQGNLLQRSSRPANQRLAQPVKRIIVPGHGNG